MLVKILNQYPYTFIQFFNDILAYTIDDIEQKRYEILTGHKKRMAESSFLAAQLDDDEATLEVDPQKNPVHSFIFDVIQHFERASLMQNKIQM